MSAARAPEGHQGWRPPTAGRLEDSWPEENIPRQSRDGEHQRSSSVGQSPSSSNESLSSAVSIRENPPGDSSPGDTARRDEPRPRGLAFSLQPFGHSAAGLALRLEGRLRRQGEHLRITYRLSGDLASVVFPAPAVAPPERADDLWQHTCFELFLAAEGEAPYWEVNLATNGAWNLYRLSAYRQGLAPVPDRDALPFRVMTAAGMLELTLHLPLPRELIEACRQRPLRLGVTAVIERQGGELSYWALAHGGPVADFHRREDFLLCLGDA